MMILLWPMPCPGLEPSRECSDERRIGALVGVVVAVEVEVGVGGAAVVGFDVVVVVVGVGGAVSVGGMVSVATGSARGIGVGV